MSGALLITGASRGIGAACAIAAAADGWAVGVNYNSNAAAAEKVVGAITASGGRAIALPGNVAREADVRAMYDGLEAAFGPLRGLINNAGILDAPARLVDIDLARWQRIFDTNTTGSFLVLREALRRMEAAGNGGAVVNMSSMAAPLGAANEFVDYAASKGAVESMTIGLAREMAPLGIRINAIRPGLIDTDMQKTPGGGDRLARLMHSVPMGRAGRADEVAAAAVWLLSDAASYITGAIIPVSGGR